LNATRTRRTLRSSLTIVVGSALLLGLGACAPGKSKDDVLAGDSPTITMAQWRQDVDSCMKTAGFDIGGSGSDGMTASVDTSKYDQDAFNRVYTGCIKKIGDAPVDENQPSEDEMFAAQLAFAKCMRDAGYDFPDPVKGGMSQAFGPDTDPKVVDACSAKAKEAEGAK